MALFFDLSDRLKLRFSGPQALWYLDQLVTNQVVELPWGRARTALLLNPKGRITAVLRVLATGEEALVDIEEADRQAVLDFFKNRIFATKVEVGDVTEEFALLRLFGPQARDHAGSLAPGALLHEANRVVTVSEFGYLVSLEEPLEAVDLWVRRQEKDYIFRTLVESGVQSASHEEYEAYRVTKGGPRFGVDFDSSYLPQEAALERAVHFKKGCYLGQEAVAMAQRGTVKRRVRHLHLFGPPVPGELWHDEAKVGLLTSAAGSFGIGTVKTVIQPGEEVEVRSDGQDAGRARVEVLPGTVEGPSVPSARELRERLRRGS
jgi:folate-binding protein YgfZ